MKELPYKDYLGYVLKSEPDANFTKNKTAYIYEMPSPKCFYLFIPISTAEEPIGLHKTI